MAIPTEFIKKTCKIGQGYDCCRYLACGKSGFQCLKHTTLSSQVNARAVAKTMVARADNCNGWNEAEQKEMGEMKDGMLC